MIGGIGRSSAYYDCGPDEGPQDEEAFVREAVDAWRYRSLPEGATLDDVADGARRRWRREHPDSDVDTDDAPEAA